MNRQSMTPRLADLPLIVKIGLPPAIALVMLAVLAAMSIFQQKAGSAQLRQVVQVEMPASDRIQALSQRITADHGELYRLLTDQAGSIDIKAIDGHMKGLLADLDGVTSDLKTLRTSANPAEQPTFDKLIKQLSDTRSAVDLVGSMLGSDFQTAAGFVAPFEDSYRQMTSTLAKVVADQRQRTQNKAQASYSRAEAAVGMMIVATVSTLVVVSAIAFILSVTTRNAVQRIASATQTLAQGGRTVDLERLRRGDELGDIVASLKVFQDNQRHLEDLRSEQERSGAIAADERRAKEDATAAAARDQMLVVTALAEGLDHLASGDLAHRIVTAFPGHYSKLREDFNTAITRLEETIAVILSTTSRLQSGSLEIVEGSAELSERTERQAATLEETAAAMDEITVTVKKTAEGALGARDVVVAAKDGASKSGEVVKGAIHAMGEIASSSRQISQIIGVIDEIAFQTNLLALNAGVEAARAGDAGRGFAVVASEVRSLAQRSAEAAKEIKGLIAASTAHVGRGVTLVDQTGVVLDQIVGQVAEINVIVSEIAASANEQALGVKQVNAAINQMDQATQRNAAMVQESTTVSRDLGQDAEELGRLMSRFSINPSKIDAMGHAAAPPAKTGLPLGGRQLAAVSAVRSAVRKDLKRAV